MIINFLTFFIISYLLMETELKYDLPSAIPPLMILSPPRNLSVALNKGGAINYFQNYRNDVLSRFMMPRYKWGVNDVPYVPRDYLPSKRVNRDDDHVMDKNINITAIDYARMKEIDDLYKAIKRHRKQYKDYSGELYPVTFFKADKYKYDCAPSMTPSNFSHNPTRHVQYRDPVTLPITYERRSHTPYIPEFSISAVYPSKPITFFRQ